MKILIIFLNSIILFKEFGIVLSIIVLLLFFYESNFIFWLELVYKNYKTNYKIFNDPMKKIGIIILNILTHRNHVVFRKSKSNLFLIIEKVTLTFKNLNGFMNEYCFNSEGCNIPRIVEKLIHPINEILKLNFDGSKINNISASGWVIRDTNGTIKMTGSRHLGNESIITIKCVALRYGVLATRLNGFFNLKIEGDSKSSIYCYKNKSNLPNLIILLIYDI